MVEKRVEEAQSMGEGQGKGTISLRMAEAGKVQMCGLQRQTATEPEGATPVGSCLGPWKEGYQMLLVLLGAGTEESLSQFPPGRGGQAGRTTGRRTGQDETGQVLTLQTLPRGHGEAGRRAIYKGKKRRFFLFFTYIFFLNLYFTDQEIENHRGQEVCPRSQITTRCT